MFRGYLVSLSLIGSMHNPTVILEKVSIIRCLGLRHTKQKILSVRYGSQKMEKSIVVWTHNINARTLWIQHPLIFWGSNDGGASAKKMTQSLKPWEPRFEAPLTSWHWSGVTLQGLDQQWSSSPTQTMGETGHQQKPRQESTGRTSDGVWELH